MIDKKTFSERLEKAIGDKKTRAFARKCKVDEKIIRNYLDGKSLPTLKTLSKIAEGCGKTIGWFTDDDAHQEITKEDYSRIPLYDVYGSAGPGAWVGEETVLDVLAFRTNWLRNELGVDPKKLSLIFVAGDSMEPTLRSGDMVLVDHESRQNITEGIWLIRMGDGTVIKRVQRLRDNKIIIKSDNDIMYAPIEIDLNQPTEDLEFIGQVIWSGKRM